MSIPKARLTNAQFLTYKKIADFVSQLNDVVGEMYHGVALYSRLLNHTNFSHKTAIEKHISLFTAFCERNQDAIYAKDAKKLTQTKIQYSSKVFLDVGSILKNIKDEDTIAHIWNHIIVIYASIEPDGEAMKMLHDLQPGGSTNSNNEGSKEAEFMSTFIQKIEQSVDKEKLESKDPMTAAMSILQSGVLNDLVGSMGNGVKEGQLDMGRLFGTVQGMLQNGNSNSSSSVGMPDMGSMMGMLGGMLNGQTNACDMLSAQDKFKANIEKQVQVELEKEKSENRPKESTKDVFTPD